MSTFYVTDQVKSCRVQETLKVVLHHYNDLKECTIQQGEAELAHIHTNAINFFFGRRLKRLSRKSSLALEQSTPRLLKACSSLPSDIGMYHMWLIMCGISHGCSYALV